MVTRCFAARDFAKRLRRNAFRRTISRMVRRSVSRVLLCAAVAAGTVGGVASPAWAPKYIFGSLAFGGCGLPDDTATFSGDFTVLGFSSDKGQLLVTASVTGSCLQGLTVMATAPTGVYTFPVVSLVTECVAESAVVEIRPGAATVGGVLGDKSDNVKFVLDLYPSTVIDRIWMEGDPESERGRLCALDRMLDRHPAADLATELNQLVLRV
jgi:hypothetical protein